MDNLRHKIISSVNFYRIRYTPDSTVRVDRATIDDDATNDDEVRLPPQEVNQGQTGSSTVTEDKDKTPKPKLSLELRQLIEANLEILATSTRTRNPTQGCARTTTTQSTPLLKIFDQMLSNDEKISAYEVERSTWPCNKTCRCLTGALKDVLLLKQEINHLPVSSYTGTTDILSPPPLVNQEWNHAPRHSLTASN